MLTASFLSGGIRRSGLGAQSWWCRIMIRLRRWTRWWGSMTSCGWHGWHGCPARNGRANLSRPARLPLVADQVSSAVTLAAMARQVFSLLPGHHPSVGAHRRPERVGSAFSHHLVQLPNGTEAASVGSSPPGPRTDFAFPSTDGLQGLRGACLARDRVSLSRAILESVNHPSEVTQSPIEIQLRALRTTLGDDLVRDLEDSVAPNTWRAYRSDLADFATSVAYTSAEWRAPEVVAAYLRTLEDGGAAYATITRRLTSIHKLVAIAAFAAGDLDYEDPTKHPRVRVTLQAIRRRLSTDQDQANPLTSQRLLQVLLSIDTATVAGMRDVALLLVGWYGALRRSELAGLGRDHLSLEGEGLVLQLPRSKASPDHSVWVPIANQPDSVHQRIRADLKGRDEGSHPPGHLPVEPANGGYPTREDPKT